MNRIEHLDAAGLRALAGLVEGLDAHEVDRRNARLAQLRAEIEADPLRAETLAPEHLLEEGRRRGPLTVDVEVDDAVMQAVLAGKFGPPAADEGAS